MKSTVLIALVAAFFLGCKSNDSRSEGPQSDQNQLELLDAINSSPKYELSESQRESLLFMWEEEKIARDVYITLGNQYGMRIFSNISSSEQRHMDAVKSLIEKYEIPLIGSEEVGVFVTPAFQQLYDDLISRGFGSSTAALEVGRDIELLDIEDLENLIQDATPDMELVYNNLLQGSYNHLSAFERNLAK